MKRMIGALVVSAAALAGVAVPADAAGEDVPMRFAVWTYGGASVGSIAEDAGASVDRAIVASRNVFLLSAPAPAGDAKRRQEASKRLAAGLRKDRRVSSAEPLSSMTLGDERFHAWPSGDPEAAEPSDLARQPAFSSFQLERVHSRTTGRGVIVALLDTGVDADHPLLRGSILPGYDMVDDDGDPTDTADGVDGDGDGHVDRAYGHGTFLAGVIHQLAPGAMILPVRVLDDEGRGDLAAVVEGIDYAVESGALVINLSLGIAGKVGFPPVDAALKRARQAGAIVLAAAGNRGEQTEFYPAAVKDVISVTALSDDGVGLAAFANRGKWVDVAAPGVDIVSSAPGNRYVRWGGSSMAVGVVSGELALMAEKRPRGNAKDIETALWKSCRRNGRIDTAHGSIDVLAAVTPA